MPPPKVVQAGYVPFDHTAQLQNQNPSLNKAASDKGSGSSSEKVIRTPASPNTASVEKAEYIGNAA